MNPDRLATMYDRLTPEERFRLILAASGRNDDVERQRLGQAGRLLHLSVPDHTPWAHAFDELATFYFLELTDLAASYLESFLRADLIEADDTGQSQDTDDTGGDPPDADVQVADDNEDTWTMDGEFAAQSPGERMFRLALAQGHILKVKTEGWKLFCNRLNIPPFILWEQFPGFERLMSALKLAERAAFTEEGLVRWLNEMRPVGEPQHTQSPYRVVPAADAIDRGFRQRVRWWGG